VFERIWEAPKLQLMISMYCRPRPNVVARLPPVGEDGASKPSTSTGSPPTD